MVFFKTNIVSDIGMTNTPAYYIEAVIRRAESVIDKTFKENMDKYSHSFSKLDL